jgi:hypothetical protein
VYPNRRSRFIGDVVILNAIGVLDVVNRDKVSADGSDRGIAPGSECAALDVLKFCT